MPFRSSRHGLLPGLVLRGLGLMLACAAIASCATTAAQPDVARPIPPDQVSLVTRTAAVGGGSIAWAQLGTGDTPVVLLNGTGSPMAEWDPAFLGQLAARQRVIVMDYPGLGGSSALRGRLTFDRLAATVARWLDRIEVPRAHIVGWSMGTFVAQRLAIMRPDLVDRLVLVGGNPGGRETVLGPRWVQRADSDPAAGLDTYLRTNYPADRCAQSAGRAFLRRQSAAVESGRYPPDRVPARTYDAMVAAEDPWLRSDRNLRQLRAVTAPTLVLVGRNDVITPPANSRRLAAQIPGAGLTTVVGAGHSVLFQSPIAAAGIDSFLTGQLGPSSRMRLASGCPAAP